MRRSLQFCGWKANWWKVHAERRLSLPAHLHEGILAYALQHASAEQQRLISWSIQWAAIRERAAVVLGAHLVGREDQIIVLDLDIELEDDEEEQTFMLEDEDEA